jgi:hypothetical protein
MSGPVLAVLLAVLPPAAAQTTGKMGTAVATTATQATAVQLPEAVDLSWQFPTDATRDQGDTGSCHVFTTVALLEAALKRRWNLAHTLSEADLFARKVVADPDYYDGAKKAVASGKGLAPVYEFIEAGSVIDDLRFAIAHGAVRQETAPWADFEKRYLKFVADQKAAIDPKVKAVAQTGDLLQEVRSAHDRVTPETGGGADRTAQIYHANVRRVETKISGAYYGAQDDLSRFLAQIEGRTEAEAQGVLLGDDPKLAKERAVYKSLFTGFTASKWEFETPAADAKQPSEKACRDAGAERKTALLAALLKGVPVAVTLDLGGLAEWGKYPLGSRHAFTITGYEKGKDGGIVLKSRNSWGGKNPDVDEKRFCKISRVVVLRTDKEK